jgi:ferredoxin
MKVKVDKNICIGCGTCVVIAPKSFKLGDDCKAEIVEPQEDNKEKIKEAVDSCPVSAIKSTDQDEK